jgi:hypothetical protein
MADKDSVWGKRLLWIASFAVAFFVVKALTQSWFDKRSEKRMAAASEQKMASIREEAAKRHPDLPVSEAMKQEAGRQMTETIESQSGDRAKQANTAADQFWGFALVNTRSRVEFCRELGVDISSFKQAFESVHREEIARATAIDARRNVDREKVYQVLREQMRRSTEQDMRDLAKGANTDLPGACRAVAENAAALAEEIRFSKSLPAVHKALMAAP